MALHCRAPQSRCPTYMIIIVISPGLSGKIVIRKHDVFTMQIRVLIPVICRPFPLLRRRHKAMFNRVVMDVIHVTMQILFIADGMFPKPPLPQPAFPLALLMAGAHVMHINDIPELKGNMSLD